MYVHLKKGISMAIKVTTFPVGLYQCNCSIIYCEETLEAIVIDPGSEAELILKKIEDQGLSVNAGGLLCWHSMCSKIRPV